ncbi:hypothetical protein Dsin_010027 [Dipteronia sinensis]|uniref:Reverse transcriptase domain-containing protein n=1 Tax=Dipteronia sinensis TaxID=43782 RepID=A0AAE0ASY2_9ROSI|nr:hypothetical protein Dsin_010027 [Dipteronia sinensis]
MTFLLIYGSIAINFETLLIRWSSRIDNLAGKRKRNLSSFIRPMKINQKHSTLVNHIKDILCLPNKYFYLQSFANLPSVLSNIVACGSLLDSWNASKKRELRTNILIRRAALKEASNAVIPASWRVISNLEHYLHCALDTEERYWWQHARVEWLSEGDRNTRFFHSKASARRSRNSIAGLINEKGEWVEKKNELEDVISQYFKNIFSTSSLSLANIAAITNGVHAKFDSSSMSVLNKPFDAVEIRSVVFDISPMKAPGRDGLHALFYHKYWSTIGPAIISACLGILNDRVSAESINSTIISLIPKCQTPKATTDFRPISLCNVIYKIVVKVVASRLRRILRSVIAETQCAFIPGRMI